MNSNRNYSQFIEHSFRQLTLLIHQQDTSDITTTTTSVSANKTTKQSLPLINNEKSNINSNELESFSSKIESHHQSINDNLIDSNEPKVKIEQIPRTHRTYMRPPKNRTTISYHYSSSEFSDRPDTSLNHSLNSPCSPSITQQQSNELPVHMPYERSLYDIRFEKDRQNDVREKYNIPPPFQRKWLRQPRYIPQERPKFGQVQQPQNQ